LTPLRGGVFRKETRMPSLSIASRAGGTTTLSAEALAAFRQGLRGKLLLREDPGYDQARAVWNAMIDRRPAAIVQCTGAADVIRCVTLAREAGLLLSVRGAGHNIAGKAVCDGGLMVDLSQMRGVTVDPQRRTARVGPGATLADLDHETQAFGLATPVGINSTTGVAGLTLGGGFGWLSRKYGLTVDNLLSVTMVTAAGEQVTATEKKNADLFWAVRGGGGNLGIVTEFEFRLHKVGPEVLSGLIVHPFADADRVLRHYRAFVGNAPEDVTCWVMLRKAPPLPFLPPTVHGTDVVVIAVLTTAGPRKGKQLLKPLREFGTPIADVVGPHQYLGWQQAFDPLLTPGARNYWRSHNFRELPDAALEVLRDYAGRLPSNQSDILIAQLGGAINAKAPDATAYPHRDVNFAMTVHTRWEDKSRDQACVAWAREFSDRTAPFASGGVYVNFVSEGEERVRAAYGGNYARLAKLKREYDPTNLFSMNQNVAPA
jgi:FAD/FMN-containing dehydrogenase